MSEGIGDYIRSIASAVGTKITPMMCSFLSSLIYSALTSELSKINTDLHPHFEYDKERDGWYLSFVHPLERFSDLSTYCIWRQLGRQTVGLAPRKSSSDDTPSRATTATK
ncbi:hypothetical protein J3R83DRAFT_9390 [Lanmaoa asiatica]|nr:hypothetical protein J3R83DRAFT_9390 [Lanmaoa asiatica]